jgi:hypothetical protein
MTYRLSLSKKCLSYPRYHGVFELNSEFYVLLCIRDECSTCIPISNVEFLSIQVCYFDSGNMHFLNDDVIVTDQQFSLIDSKLMQASFIPSGQYPPRRSLYIKLSWNDDNVNDCYLPLCRQNIDIEKNIFNSSSVIQQFREIKVDHDCPLLVGEAPLGDMFEAIVWDCGLLFCHYLLSHCPHLINGKKIIELGNYLP